MKKKQNDIDFFRPLLVNRKIVADPNLSLEAKGIYCFITLLCENNQRHWKFESDVEKAAIMELVENNYAHFEDNSTLKLCGI